MIDLRTFAFLVLITTQLADVWTKKVPCGAPMDVAFLIDSSSSLFKNDFAQQMAFVLKLAGIFDIAPDKTRVAAVTFSDTTNVEFLFSEGTTSGLVQQKLAKIKHKAGTATYTHDGLAAMVDTVFKKGNGERPEYSDVIVLLTDGASTNKYKTSDEAIRAKKAGIKIIAIGIGNVLKDELENIVSAPASDNFFYIQDFTDLNSNKTFLESVGQKTCEVTTTTTTTTTTTQAPTTTTTAPPPPISTPDYIKDKPEKDCQKKEVDLVFIVDMSSSIWSEHFKEQKQFLADLVDIFDISSGKTQVGMITFSDDAIVNFYLNTYHNKQDIVKAIKNVKQEGGITNTHLAFQKYLDDVYTVKKGVRVGIGHIVILITDGRSRVPELTIPMAQKIQKLGITVFAIGVGNMTDTAELKQMASKPVEKYMYEVNGYDALPEIKNELAYKTCDESTNDKFTCSGIESEVVFGLFGIGGSERIMVEQMISYITESYDFATGNVKFGIREGCVDSNSDLTTSNSDVISAVTANIMKGLQSTILGVRSTFSKSRKANKVAILFLNTDASYLEFNEILTELKRLKFSSSVAIVGIGDGFSDEQLKKLAGATNSFVPGKIEVFQTKGLSTEEVPIFVKELNGLLC